MAPETCDDLVIAYIFVDGEAYPYCIFDRHTITHKEGQLPVVAALTAPSRYVEEYMRDVDPLVKKMFSSIGIQNGRLVIQSFHDEDGFHFFEAGFRVCGGDQCWINRSEFGVDDREYILRHALTGRMTECDDVKRCTPRYESVYCNLSFVCGEGTISRIEGEESVRDDPRVINLTMFRNVGDYVENDGTLKQVMARATIKAPDWATMRETIREISKKIVAYDENGKSMMLTFFEL